MVAILDYKFGKRKQRTTLYLVYGIIKRQVKKQNQFIKTVSEIKMMEEAWELNVFLIMITKKVYYMSFLSLNLVRTKQEIFGHQ